MTVLARAALGVERLLAPLDAARAGVLRVAAPVLGPLFADRALRVGIAGALSVLGALGLATFAPLWALTWGPLVLGVPHLAADARYLVVRQGLLRRPRFWLCVAPWLLAGMAAPASGFGCAAVGAAALCARGRTAPRVVVALTCAAFAWLLARLGPRGDVLVAHAHNVVALAVWCLWARGARRAVWPGLLAFALAVVLVLSGAAERVVDPGTAYVSAQLGLDLGAFVPSLSPSPDPAWALRASVLFALAQSVHYAIWLRLIPEHDRARRGVRSFRASYRALTADLGVPLVLGALLATLALCLWGLFDLAAARAAYLRLALCHGPLELAVLAYTGLERGALRRAQDAA